MFKKRFVCCAFLLILFSSISTFAKDYYICVASYWNESFAEKLVDDLEKEGLSAVIDEIQKGYDTYYRVLINLNFDSAQEARKKCEEIKNLPSIEKLNLDGIWICEGTKIREKQNSNQQEKPKVKTVNVEPVVLTTNKDNEIIVTKQKPYSVMVRSYKDAENAENDKRRLKNKNIEAYILKTYDEKELFSFNVHAGAFETAAEASALQEKLIEIGIEDTTVSDYREVAASIEKYNEIIEEKAVVFENVNAQLPEDFSDGVKTVVKQFPVNQDFQIMNIMIVDLENARKHDFDDIPLLPGIDERTKAISMVNYRDDLFHKDVTVKLFSGKPGAYDALLLENDDTLDSIDDEVYLGLITFDTANGKVKCELYQSGNDFILDGVNEDKSFQIYMEAENFTVKEFNEFLNNSFNDSSYLVYPQLRKSLFVLPNVNPSVRRDFVYFTLDKIGMDYAEARGYADWALGIVGHWESASMFYQEDKILATSFFDLEYDYNAEKIYDWFRIDRKSDSIAANNHPVKIFETDGWYKLNYYRNNELSFATKSYIVAIDSYYDSGMLSEDDLLEVAEDLQIWE